MKSVLVQQLWLTASVVVMGLALWLPVWGRFGAVGVESLIIAAAICIASGCVFFVFQAMWIACGLAGLGALVGGVLRIVFVLAGLLLIRRFRPEIPVILFGGVLSAFYLLSLGVETFLLVRSLDRVPNRSA